MYTFLSVMTEAMYTILKKAVPENHVILKDTHADFAKKSQKKPKKRLTGNISIFGKNWKFLFFSFHHPQRPTIQVRQKRIPTFSQMWNSQASQITIFSTL